MDYSKLYYLVSFAVLSVFMFFFSELYLASKGMGEFPAWARTLPYSFSGGHILSVLAISPIVFLTSNLKVGVKNLAVVILLVPLIVLFVLGLNLNGEQVFSFIAVDLVN